MWQGDRLGAAACGEGSGGLRGVVLLTGTAIVPPPAFTLAAGDEVIVATTGLGELRNVVEVAGRPRLAGGG
ncbi:MAG TPA: hypothetical protein VLW44_15400 [Streptosporangiaceae bacterium]|nr:hypothetical protein [Streptosporangiaceae bacterium]